MIKVAVLGSGNIGSDLTERLLRNSNFEVFALVGRNVSSKGLERFRNRVPQIISEGIDGLRPYMSEIDGIFDATSAQSAQENWEFAKTHNKWLIDLTPSKIGTPFVPTIAGKISGIQLARSLSHNYSMVTCGGQSAAPIVYAICTQMSLVNQVEVSSSISALSAGIATRNNIDQYIESTEELLQIVSGASKVKAILIINPSTPAVPMRTTVTVNGVGGWFESICEQVKIAVDSIKEANPGYELVGDPYQIDEGTYSVTVRVSGAGYYLPSYAGNLDIINSAAVLTAQMHANSHQQNGKL